LWLGICFRVWIRERFSFADAISVGIFVIIGVLVSLCEHNVVAVCGRIVVVVAMRLKQRVWVGVRVVLRERVRLVMCVS
jgi:hypothetical protein